MRPMETRTALVTGAARGLGQEFAVALAGRGYRVAGLDRVPQPRTAARVLDYVESVADPADGDQVRDALDRIVDHFGTLHVLVNGVYDGNGVYGSAGSVFDAAFEETTVQEWQRVVRLALEAPFLLTRAVLPYLKKAGRGRIVNIALPGASSAPGVAHAVSRAGLVGFTRALAVELRPHGITVNTIAPGTVRTTAAELTSTLTSTLLYVVDERSGLLTGQTLTVDGGGPGRPWGRPELSAPPDP
ncbi:3-oxoacyl-(acyl-carrier-protein) reductase [Actinobacteria bacterium OK074]|nr:3-oxoacyl-(acyl-carrier-protein) reductase [Actinobacteria bacterium OK074]